MLLYITLVLGVVALVVLALKLKSSKPKTDVLEQARERARQRKHDRAFQNTEPVEDPYGRAYTLSGAMSAVEVDESANGYGMLDDEQKRIITAIFDNHAQVPASINRGSPNREKDIWAITRN